MTKVKTYNINIEKLACLSLTGVCVALFAMYMYFVSASVIHVVIRKEINHDLLALNSEISQLESEYIDAQHRVSSDIASMQGYKLVATKIFIDRSQPSLVLSNNEQR